MPEVKAVPDVEAVSEGGSFEALELRREGGRDSRRQLVTKAPRKNLVAFTVGGERLAGASNSKL